MSTIAPGFPIAEPDPEEEERKRRDAEHRARILPMPKPRPSWDEEVDALLEARRVKLGLPKMGEVMGNLPPRDNDVTMAPGAKRDLLTYTAEDESAYRNANLKPLAPATSLSRYKPNPPPPPPEPEPSWLDKYDVSAQRRAQMAPIYAEWEAQAAEREKVAKEAAEKQAVVEAEQRSAAEALPFGVDEVPGRYRELTGDRPGSSLATFPEAAEAEITGSPALRQEHEKRQEEEYQKALAKNLGGAATFAAGISPFVFGPAGAAAARGIAPRVAGEALASASPVPMASPYDVVDIARAVAPAVAGKAVVGGVASEAAQAAPKASVPVTLPGNVVVPEAAQVAPNLIPGFPSEPDSPPRVDAGALPPGVPDRRAEVKAEADRLLAAGALSKERIPKPPAVSPPGVPVIPDAPPVAPVAPTPPLPEPPMRAEPPGPRQPHLEGKPAEAAAFVPPGVPKVDAPAAQTQRAKAKDFRENMEQRAVERDRHEFLMEFVEAGTRRLRDRDVVDGQHLKRTRDGWEMWSRAGKLGGPWPDPAVAYDVVRRSKLNYFVRQGEEFRTEAHSRLAAQAAPVLPPGVPAAPKSDVATAAHTPAMVPIDRRKVGVADLAADYKARGMERTRAWGEFVKNRDLSPEIDAKEFYKVYDSVSADPLRPKAASKAVPTPETPRALDPEFADYGKPVRVTVKVGRQQEVREGAVERTLKTGTGGFAYEVRFTGEDGTRRVPGDSVEFTQSPVLPPAVPRADAPVGEGVKVPGVPEAKPSLADRVAEVKAKKKADAEARKAFVKDYGPAPFEVPSRDGFFVLRVTPSTTEKGKWQATRFDKDGPVGHMTRPYEKLLEEIQYEYGVDLAKANVAKPREPAPAEQVRALAARKEAAAAPEPPFTKAASDKIRADANKFARGLGQVPGNPRSGFSKDARQKAIKELRAAADEAVRDLATNDAASAALRDKANDANSRAVSAAKRGDSAGAKSARAEAEALRDQMTRMESPGVVEIDLGAEGKFRIAKTPEAIATVLNRLEKPNERPPGVIGTGPLMGVTPGTVGGKIAESLDTAATRVHDAIAYQPRLQKFESGPGTTLADDFAVTREAKKAAATTAEEVARSGQRGMTAAEKPFVDSYLNALDGLEDIQRGIIPRNGKTAAEFNADITSARANVPQARLDLFQQRYKAIADETGQMGVASGHLDANDLRENYVPHLVKDFYEKLENRSIPSGGVRESVSGNFKKREGTTRDLEDDPWRALALAYERAKRTSLDHGFKQKVLAHDLTASVRADPSSFDKEGMALYSFGRPGVPEAMYGAHAELAIRDGTGAPTAPITYNAKQWHVLPIDLAQGLAEALTPGKTSEIAKGASYINRKIKSVYLSLPLPNLQYHITQWFQDFATAAHNVPVWRTPELAYRTAKNVKELTAEYWKVIAKGERSPLLEALRDQGLLGETFESLLDDAADSAHVVSEKSIPFGLRSGTEKAKAVGRAIFVEPAQIAGKVRETALKKSLVEMYENLGATPERAVSWANTVMGNYLKVGDTGKALAPVTQFAKWFWEQGLRLTTRLVTDPVTGRGWSNLVRGDLKGLARGFLWGPGPALVANYALVQLINNRNPEVAKFSEESMSGFTKFGIVLDKTGEDEQGNPKYRVLNIDSLIQVGAAMWDVVAQAANGEPAAAAETAARRVGARASPVVRLIPELLSNEKVRGGPVESRSTVNLTDDERRRANARAGGSESMTAKQQYAFEQLAGWLPRVVRTYRRGGDPTGTLTMRNLGLPVYDVGAKDKVREERWREGDRRLTRFREAVLSKNVAAANAEQKWLAAHGFTPAIVKRYMGSGNKEMALREALTPDQLSAYRARTIPAPK